MHQEGTRWDLLPDNTKHKADVNGDISPKSTGDLSGLFSFQFDDCMFSRVLTLDLSQYPDTEGQESSKRNQESR